MNIVCKTGKFIISGLGTALLLSLVFMNLVNRAYMPLNSKEHMEYNHVSIPFILFFLILLTLFIVSLRKKILQYISPQVVASISALFYLWTGLVLIYRVDPAIRADAKFCFEAAVGFLNNDYSSLERGGYLFENAHQIGFVLYEMLLAHISQDIRFVYFINLVLTLANNLLIIRLTSIMTGENEEAIKLASLLSLIFLPAAEDSRHVLLLLFGVHTEKAAVAVAEKVGAVVAESENGVTLPDRRFDIVHDLPRGVAAVLCVGVIICRESAFHMLLLVILLLSRLFYHTAAVFSTIFQPGGTV